MDMDSTEPTETQALKRAISESGSITAFASDIGVSRQTVHNWLTAGRVASVEHAIIVGRHTGIPLNELRPDIWGSPILRMPVQ